MTENEAIERLKCMRLFMEINDKQNESKFLEDDYIANKTAIKALEEIQQYRAIGTVEELQKLKLLFGNENVEISELITKILKEYPEYLSIGTVEEFKALKEKSVAKKSIGKREYNEAYCPCCNEVISDGEFWALNEYVHHCNECGQAVKGVDWE